MKFFSGKKGFTIIELIIALNLLGIVSIGTGSYISNSFKESNQISDKVNVQTSVTALMNKIETVIKTADVPVFAGDVSNTKFIINQLQKGQKSQLKFEHDVSAEKVTVKRATSTKAENTYEYIKSIKKISLTYF